MKAICQECMRIIDTRGMKVHRQSRRCVYRGSEVSLERPTTPEDTVRLSKYELSEGEYQRHMSTLLSGRGTRHENRI